jgi:cytochrome c
MKGKITNSFSIFLILLILFFMGCLGEKVIFDYEFSKTPHNRIQIEELEPNLRESVQKGQIVMKDENLGQNGLSCASCHPNPELNKIWASLFPRRWASTMNPNHRIITLAQHNYGAYKGMMGGTLEPDDPSFNDLNAYLMWLGDGNIIWEKELPGGFQLSESIARGGDLFYDKGLGDNGKSCSNCHKKSSMKGVVSIFPKYSEIYDQVFILDTFIIAHAKDTLHADIDLMSNDLADLSSYLTNLSKAYAISLKRA